MSGWPVRPRASHGARSTQTRFKRMNEIVPEVRRTQTEGKENFREVQCWALRVMSVAVREGRWLEKGKGGSGMDQGAQGLGSHGKVWSKTRLHSRLGAVRGRPGQRFLHTGEHSACVK